MKRRRGLSTEDKVLWSRVAASVDPLHPGGRHPAPADDPPPALTPTKIAPSRQAAEPVPPPSLAGLRLGNRKDAASTRIDLSPLPNEALDAQPLRMDHKTHRQMTRGKLSPEARIDLHGMTLAVAQPVLTRFIMQARADGLRLVLVITGKGRAGGPDAPLPVRPGALRHNVPHWLHMPPLSTAVLQVRPAHRRHGGEGAYYVYLRR